MEDSTDMKQFIVFTKRGKIIEFRAEDVYVTQTLATFTIAGVTVAAFTINEIEGWVRRDSFDNQS